MSKKNKKKKRRQNKETGSESHAAPEHVEGGQPGEDTKAIEPESHSAPEHVEGGQPGEDDVFHLTLNDDHDVEAQDQEAETRPAPDQAESSQSEDTDLRLGLDANREVVDLDDETSKAEEPSSTQTTSQQPVQQPEEASVFVESLDDAYERMKKQFPDDEVTRDGNSIRVLRQASVQFSNSTEAKPENRRSIVDESNEEKKEKKSSWPSPWWLVIIMAAILVGYVGMDQYRKWNAVASTTATTPTTAAPTTSTPAPAAPDPRIAELEQQVRERDLQILNLEKEVAAANAVTTELRTERNRLRLRNHNINGNIEILSEDGLNHFVQNGQHPDVIRLREEIKTLKEEAKTKIEEVWGLLRTERSKHHVELEKVRKELTEKLESVQRNLDSMTAQLSSQKNWEKAYTKASSDRNALRQQVTELQATITDLQSQLKACTAYTPPPITILTVPTVPPHSAPVDDCFHK